MKRETPKVKLNLTIDPQIKFKAQTIAHTMGITISHLFEGLIEGMQFVPGRPEDKN